MSPRSLIPVFGAACLAAALLAPAHAAQVRVTLATNTYSPQNVSVNLGDHVVWIWTGTNAHDVKSGDPDLGVPDSRFDSQTPATNRTFSWRTAGALGLQEYYCSIHLPDMRGALTVVNNGSGVAGSDFRITEVLYNPTSGPDQVEITNFGATGDLSKYRLKVNGLATLSLQVNPTNGTPTSTSMSVPAGGRVVITLGAAGTNSATALFYSTASLGNSGAMALYVPNTQSTSLTDATQIVDYVSWNGGSELEGTPAAVTAGLWPSAGATVPDVAQGHSLEFCGIAAQYGPTFWSEVSSPNLGSNGNCSTPLVRSTWGRVKSLYR